MNLSQLPARRILGATLLVALVLLSSPEAFCAASTPGLEIVSVIMPGQVPYNSPIPVTVTVRHDASATPSVAVYYWVLPNSTAGSTGWRLVPTTAVQKIAEQYMTTTTFAANLPSPVFGDVLSYGTRLVVWMEAVSQSARVATAPESGRWDPNDLRGKFVVDITDPYPPVIASIVQLPQQPTSSNQVLVRAKLAKRSPSGGNITRADLEYSINDILPGTTVVMTTSEPSAWNCSFFEATIPAQVNGSRVAYRISSVDEAGNEVVSDWVQYVVGPSEAEIQAAEQIKAQEQIRVEELGKAQAQLFQRIMISAVVLVAAAIAAIAYWRRARLRPYIKSRATEFKTSYDAFSVSVLLSLAVVAWAAYSLWSQYYQVWLALAALLAQVELVAVLDPRIPTVFGLFRAPSPTKSSAVLDAFRSPGAPLLISAYALLFVGILSTAFLYVAGFVDRQGFLSITDFFASRALIMVGLGAVVRYLAYRQFRSQANQT